MWNEFGQRAKAASRSIAQATNQQRVNLVCLMADRLECNAAGIMAANGLDLRAGRQAGLTEAMLDRLYLNGDRIRQMADGLRALAELPDPLATVLMERTRPDGLQIRKVAVPLGVIAVIYEARPNVTADAAGLCIRSGNACILRGGKEALNTNLTLAGILRGALEALDFPADTLQLIRDEGREGAQALMHMHGSVDLLIPRGGKGLIDEVVRNATVPVLQTGEGVCHIVVDWEADVGMAVSVIHNAKVSRPSVCNAAECLLIHRDIAETALPKIAEKLMESGVTIHADAASLKLLPAAVPAGENDWGREYLSLDIACRIVDSLEEAMEHIRRYGSGHSEAIITGNQATAERFLREVDAAAVYHNASTRFTDGGEFGFGAEIGISTQKLHARGPVGLAQLTTSKFIIHGEGHIR